MILIRVLIFCLSCLFLIVGITTMISPDVNTIFLPFTADSVQEAHFARTYAGFVTAVGYLSMRFLYSSSKVQIGTVVMYITMVMVISKIFSFIYDGYTTIAVATFFIGIAYAIGLYVVQKARKNELDYNL
tara:strand:+ start:855 stop:1244 length:390 start_codon:yes stop_codon:yes gene_type:complete